MLFRNEGYCCICEAGTIFVARDAWLRDNYLCVRCGSIPRARAVLDVLDIVAPAWRSGALHESSPSTGYIALKCPGYSYSFFYEDVAPGTTKDGNRCENLEALTFPDSSFDVFVTQDVLEHVFRPDLALAEVMRVLNPGGLHVFTTPKHKHLLKSERRAAFERGQVRHLLPPQYHGNPIDAKGSLVTWDYGADFDDLIRQWAGYCVSVHVIRDRQRGIDGEYLDIFVVRKTEVNRV